MFTQKLLAIGCSILFVAASSFCQTLVGFPNTGDVLNANAVDDNVEASSITKTTGNPTSPCTHGLSHGSASMVGGTFDIDSMGTYFQFQIKPKAGMMFTVTQFNLTSIRGSNGAQRLRISYSLDSGMTWTSKAQDTVEQFVCQTTPTNNMMWDMPDFAVSNESHGVIFRVNGWGAGTAGGTWQTLGMSVWGSSALLPVELVSFTGVDEKGKTRLSWMTSSENDNDYFQVEHSTNGVNYFSLGKVNGAGVSLSPKYYSYLHENPKQGRNYYRLKQVDFNGNFEYSHIIPVSVQREGSNWQLKPNPASDRLVLTSDITDEEVIRVKICSAEGVVMMETPLSPATNEVEISGLPQGQYYFTIITPKESIVRKFIKL